MSQIKDAVPDKVTVSTIDSDAVDSTLKAGDADGVLVFPSDFASQLQSGGATVTLRVEGSNPAASAQLKQLAGLLVTALSQSHAAAPLVRARTATPQVSAQYDLSLRWTGVHADRRAGAALHRPLRLLLRLSADRGGLPARAVAGDAGAADGLAAEPDGAGAGLRDGLHALRADPVHRDSAVRHLCPARALRWGTCH